MNKEEKKIKQLRIEYFSIQCLLENFMKAYIEIPENAFEEAYQELENKIREDGFFDAEQYGGDIKIEGKYINALNCKKVIGLIY